MAGIGFELKKLFSEDNSIFEDIKAVIYSSFIGVGPWILTVITLNILMIIGKEIILIQNQQNLFIISITYSFIFSQILAGTIQYLITRFISDCIYTGQQKKLKSTYIGSIKFISVISFFVAVIFFKNQEVPWFFSYTLIILFCFLSGIWVSMNFISIIRNYLYIIISYSIGNGLAILLGIYLLKFSKNEFFKKNLAYSIIFSYTIGVAVIFFMLYSYLTFILEDSNESEFEFLTSLKKYTSLIFIGIFYNLSIVSHIFINWWLGDSYKIAGIFLSSPLFEVAFFYSFFLTIPTMIYFLVFIETKFFPIYKTYYAFLIFNKNLKEINIKKEKMFKILKEEIYYTMELQFFVSFSIVLLSKSIFVSFGINLYLLDLFRIMIFASYCTAFISIYITMFLYFDSKKEALFISILFFLSNIIFSIITTSLGKKYIGLGFFIASFITLISSDIILNILSKNLNYITFYKQNFSSNLENSFLKKFEEILNKRFFIPIFIIILSLLIGCTNYTVDGFNKKTKRNWHTMSYYNKAGYDYDGYNQDGVNIRGFTKEGWNNYTDSPYDYYNFDYEGINNITKKKIDERGFNYKGENLLTNSKYDKKGFDFQGVNRETGTEYDKNGWTWYGLNKYTGNYYDKDGYNYDGFDNQGYNRAGYDENGKKKQKNEYQTTELSRFDKDGFDKDGFDKDGFDKDGFDKDGLYIGDSE